MSITCPARSPLTYTSTQIVSLRTGQAILFAPNGLGVRGGVEHPVQSDSDSGVGASDDVGTVAPIGQGYLHVQSRLRVTRDGGHSILAVNNPASTTRLGRVAGPGKEPAAPYSAWSGVEASWSTDGRAGGTSAPAEPPAEAAAPPEPHPPTWSNAEAASSFEGVQPNPVVSPAAQPNPLPNSAVPQTAPAASAPSLSTSPPVFELVGELARFKPLMDYIRPRLSKPQYTLTVKNIRKGFDSRPHVYGSGIDEVIAEAVQRGLLIQPVRDGNAIVGLVPGATYTSTSQPPAPNTATASSAAAAHPKPANTNAFALKGPNLRFVPLIRYLVEQRTAGFTKITVATIRRRFVQNVEEELSDAKSLGMVQDVANSSKPKVMLVPGITFAY